METKLTETIIPLVTSEAQANYNLITSETLRRLQTGLIKVEELPPIIQVDDYMRRVHKVNPQASRLVDKLTENKLWKKPPVLVACIPVVGTGNQEIDTIDVLFDRLQRDPLVRQGDVGILFFVNRPAGYPADDTKERIELLGQQLGINTIVMEAEVPLDLGNTDGPFLEEMATNPNQAPIGLLRDILNMSAMKLALSSGASDFPLLLQMDADFEGFMQGSFGDIIALFEDPAVRFLQCTSDWDSEDFPTASDAALLVGSQLMRELPQKLKRALNDPSLPLESRMQIIFGEAIQRGIQVPQVERMEDIARKGGYGLNRLAHDELDGNIRQAAFFNPEGVRTTDNVIFLWNNRRAVRSWQEFREPPISQWIKEFEVIDPVRRIARNERRNGNPYITEAVNKTLARFPIPKTLPGVYDDFTLPILEIVTRYLPEMTAKNIQIKQKSEDLYYVQITF